MTALVFETCETTSLFCWTSGDINTTYEYYFTVALICFVRKEREREDENVPFCSQTYRRVICNIPLHVYVASLKLSSRHKKRCISVLLFSLSLSIKTDRIYRKSHDVHHTHERSSRVLECIVQIWRAFPEKRSFCAKNVEKKYGLIIIIARKNVGRRSEPNGIR